MAVNRQLGASRVLSPGKNPFVPIGIGGRVGRRSGLAPAKNAAPVVQPVARRYTDCAFPCAFSIRLLFMHLAKSSDLNEIWMWNSAKLQIATAVTLKHFVLCDVIPLNMIELQCDIMGKTHLQSTRRELCSVNKGI
jgi:hypothetical protein